LSKKKKRKKPAIGRDALRDVQERAVPRSTQYAADPKKLKNPLNKSARLNDKILSNATKRASSRAEATRSQKDPNPLIPITGETVSLTVAALWLLGLLLVALFSYWTTAEWLESAWRSEADYSHGYIVIPLAIVLLWMRWDSFPGVHRNVDWRGLWMIGVAVVMRVIGRLAYMDFLDGYSIIPMVAGVVWLLCGLPALKWSSPAILFLIMMVPLPYRAESMLSWQLQGVATDLSTAMLRILGKPAIAEGHIIWIGDSKLMIEEACSGMRIFVGMIALALFWAATVKRSWLDRIVILAAAVPMALFVNALRITVTGILYGWFESAASRKIIHDWTGFLMIPLAALLLWAVKSYWEKLYRPLEVHNPAERLRDTPDGQRPLPETTP
jgi:exosortase